MSLRLKFNLILVATSPVGLLVARLISNRLLQEHAREDVLEQADMMRRSALAVRDHAIDEVRPLLRELPGVPTTS